MAQDSDSRKLDQYIVRFPDGMRQALKDAAKENNRSLNAEIIARLEESQELKERLKDYDALKAELDLIKQHTIDLHNAYAINANQIQQHYVILWGIVKTELVKYRKITIEGLNCLASENYDKARWEFLGLYDALDELLQQDFFKSESDKNLSPKDNETDTKED